MPGKSLIRRWLVKFCKFVVFFDVIYYHLALMGFLKKMMIELHG